MVLSTEEALALVARGVREIPAMARFAPQLDGLHVETVDADGSLALVPGAPRVAQEASGPVVDAETNDDDGAEVFAIVFCREGRLSELQVYRGDGEPVRRALRAVDFRLYPGGALRA